MLRSILQKIEKLNRQLGETEPCPDVRWSDVVRIDAMGTDTFGPFEVYLSFTCYDGSQVTVFPHHKGYAEIIESLPQRFPSIPARWHAEMAQQPWHVEHVLYSREHD
jgi:hypothetical protein